VDLVEGYAMRDHIHMLVMIPPKFSVANTIGFLKGKAAIRIFRGYMQMKRNFTGRHFGPENTVSVWSDWMSGWSGSTFDIRNLKRNARSRLDWWGSDI